MKTRGFTPWAIDNQFLRSVIKRTTDEGLKHEQRRIAERAEPSTPPAWSAPSEKEQP